jgi:hypothetical protein
MPGNRSLAIFGGAAILLVPVSAAAVQSRGDAEGLILHQLSHLFFILSMGGLAFWIGREGLAGDPGWRNVRRAALLFALWSADAFLVHWMETVPGLPVADGPDPWRMAVSGPAGALHYIARMDHLFIVPALVFLFLGLRRPARTEGADPESS